MDEALDLVRRELGPDAVVLDSQEVASRRLLPWSSNRQEIEVRAERQAALPKAAAPSAKPARVIRTLAESLSANPPTTPLLPPIVAPAFDSQDDSTVENSRAGSKPAESPGDVVSQPRLTSAQADGDSAGFAKSLGTLQSIMARLATQDRPHTSDVPVELYAQFLKLFEAGIEDDLARELTVQLRQHPAIDVNTSADTIQAILTAMVERELRCGPPIQPKPGRREIVVLVGPTGVGKTTTLAKLAGHYQLNLGLRVGLITFDTCRVGAFEQIQTYADILQAPLRAVASSDDLKAAIDELDDVDLILIDTAGHSPRDLNKLNRLSEFVKVASPDHVLLVVSATTSTKRLSSIADQFASVTPTSLVLTKLDEADNWGNLLSIARQIPTPVSYVTTGQDVPAQIEPAHPTRLAKLILGRDQIPPSSLLKKGSDPMEGSVNCLKT